MFNYQHNQYPDIEYLKMELEQYREDERRRLDEDNERRRQREAERKEEWEYQQRHANNWPEALQKQSYLFRDEASQWPIDDPDFPDDYFGPGADACDRALEIWKEVETENEAKIKELQAKIDTIKDSIRETVVDRLENEAPDDQNKNGWRHVAAAIREDDYNNWLWW